MKYILAALALLAGCVVAEGSGCVVRNHVVHAHAVTPVVVAQFLAVPVVTQYPVSVGYGGGLDSSMVLQELQLNRQVLQETLNELKAMRQGGQATNEPHLQVFNSRCASCHEKAVAANRGGNFVLLEGGKLPAEMDGADVMAISMQVATGKMPKGGKLSTEESLAIQNWVGAVAATLKQQAKQAPKMPGAK